MKKLLLFTFSVLIYSLGFSQPLLIDDASNSNISMTLSAVNPSANPNNGKNDLLIQTSATDGRTQLRIAPKGTNGAAFFNATNTSSTTDFGMINFGCRGEYGIFNVFNFGNPATPIKHIAIELDPTNAVTDEAFVVTSGDFNNNGTPSVLLKTDLNGIQTIEAKVEATVAPPDYVFEDSYNLRSLEEVENHINEFGHLPEIPSAAEFEKEGIKLGVMSFDLLKKVEELTLYIIELKKENRLLKERLEKLESKN